MGFAQIGNDLIHCVTLLNHSVDRFRGLLSSQVFSLTMVRWYGTTSIFHEELERESLSGPNARPQEGAIIWILNPYQNVRQALGVV